MGKVMATPEPSSFCKQALRLVASGSVSFIREPKHRRRWIWLVDGERPHTTVAWSLTALTKPLHNGPYVGLRTSGVDCRSAHLTERGTLLCAEWKL